MKKLVSLVLAVVLMASMFALLGTVTASAETYEVTKELVNLTFDGDAPYGIPMHRNMSQCRYDEENGYVVFVNTKNNGSMAFFGKDGSVGATIVKHNKYTDGGAEEQALYNDLFIFEANKTYRVTVDYKYLAGTTAENAYPSVAPFTNPLNDAAGAAADRTFSSRVLDYVAKIPRHTYTLTEGVLAEDTEWKTIELTFTTKEDDPGFAFGAYAGYSATSDIYAAFDNFKVEELCGSYTYGETDVYTMDEEVVTAVAGISEGNVTYENDAEKGKVVKIVGGTGGRAYIPGTQQVKANTKYYVTFDAKGIANNNSLNFGITRVHTEPGGCRLFIMGYSDQAAGSSLFIDGVKTEIKEGFNNVKTEWQSYGVIIDTGSADFITAEGKAAQGVLHDETYIFFGANESTVYFDNVKIVELSSIDNVVPEKDASTKYSIRKEKNDGTFVSAGLRFRGTVETAVKAGADEIGFVIAPVEAVASDADWYEIPTLNAAAKTAVAYDSTKDVIYGNEANGTSYQLALKGLSNAQGENIFARRFAAVMYVKTGGAYSYISLGEISYSEVAAEYAVRNID